ncbi:MAG: MarR family transcriptional regulator [Bacteroidetes bacterium]|nr:MarR family transcriptional regulator [Bacteroidota bacterium]
MTRKTEIENEIINEFAQAYAALGHSSLMGKIVALLIISRKPMSLDEISERLEMSKGPVSQISRRLKDHKLIEKVWIPGDRKDYYRAVDDIFGQAFLNYSRSMMQNRQIAEKYLDATTGSADEDIQYLNERMHEMQAFYIMMSTFNHDFIAKWREKRLQEKVTIE